MSDFSKLEDGTKYLIRVNCVCEDEWLDEVSKPFLATFRRVMGKFSDGKGNVSESPIEWFESVKNHSHYSCTVISVKPSSKSGKPTEVKK
jgi:hypothetical protein